MEGQDPKMRYGGLRSRLLVQLHRDALFHRLPQRFKSDQIFADRLKDSQTNQEISSQRINPGELYRDSRSDTPRRRR